MADQNVTWAIKSALDWTVGFLQRKGDENPRLSAEWLLSEACGLSRIELYVNFDRPLSLEERDVLRGFVSRRGKGEPLQYITGEAAFRHISVKVRPGVLIPRPETEVLVSEALATLPPLERRVALDSTIDAWEGDALIAAQEAQADDGAEGDSPLPRVELADVSSPAQVVSLSSEDVGSVGRGVDRAALQHGGVRDQAPQTVVGAALEGASSTVSPTHAAHEPVGVSEGDQAEIVGHRVLAEGASGSQVSPRKPLLVADLCTGTGCIACSIAYERPDARVIATDIAPEAVSLARENAAALGVSDRVRVECCDLGAAVPTAALGKLDLVVSNPPYVPSAVLASIPSEVADFEPRLALDGGADGLDVLRRLLPWCACALKPGGSFAFELHETCLDAAANLARDAGFVDVRIAQDLANRPRVLLGRRA